MNTGIIIPENCQVMKAIPKGKFYKQGTDAGYEIVDDILWIATIKPSILKVVPVTTDTLRYEEIQFIQMKINATDDLYTICKPLCKNIKYPLVLILEYADKFLLATCRFVPGKRDYDRNLLRNISFSHWIYSDCLSNGAKRLLENVNQAFTTPADLNEIYTSISRAVQFFPLSGTSLAHVNRLILALTEPSPQSGDGNLLQYCTPYKRHAAKGQTLKSRYNATDRYANYTYVYDYEDLWYCFMKDDDIRKTIENRRFRDITDLIYTIDSKSW